MFYAVFGQNVTWDIALWVRSMSNLYDLWEQAYMNKNKLNNSYVTVVYLSRHEIQRKWVLNQLINIIIKIFVLIECNTRNFQFSISNKSVQFQINTFIKRIKNTLTHSLFHIKYKHTLINGLAHQKLLVIVINQNNYLKLQQYAVSSTLYIHI